MAFGTCDRRSNVRLDSGACNKTVSRKVRNLLVWVWCQGPGIAFRIKRFGQVTCFFWRERWNMWAQITGKINFLSNLTKTETTRTRLFLGRWFFTVFGKRSTRVLPNPQISSVLYGWWILPDRTEGRGIKTWSRELLVLLDRARRCGVWMSAENMLAFFYRGHLTTEQIQQVANSQATSKRIYKLWSQLERRSAYRKSKEKYCCGWYLKQYKSAVRMQSDDWILGGWLALVKLIIWLAYFLSDIGLASPGKVHIFLGIGPYHQQECVWEKY